MKGVWLPWPGWAACYEGPTTLLGAEAGGVCIAQPLDAAASTLPAALRPHGGPPQLRK